MPSKFFPLIQIGRVRWPTGLTTGFVLVFIFSTTLEKSNFSMRANRFYQYESGVWGKMSLSIKLLHVLGARQHGDRHWQQDEIISMTKCNPSGHCFPPQIPLRFYLNTRCRISRHQMSDNSYSHSRMSLQFRAHQIHSLLTLLKTCPKSMKGKWSQNINTAYCSKSDLQRVNLLPIEEKKVDNPLRGVCKVAT